MLREKVLGGEGGGLDPSDAMCLLLRFNFAKKLGPSGSDAYELTPRKSTVQPDNRVYYLQNDKECKNKLFIIRTTYSNTTCLASATFL